MVTVAEVVNRFKSMADRRTGVDIDGVYGMQCVDLPNALAQWYFGKKMMGNGIDMLNAGRGNGWAVLGMQSCAAGDIFCKREAHAYGHTGLIISRSGNTIKTIEQNYGTGGGGGPCVYVTRNITDPTFTGVTRPPYSDAGRSNGESSENGGFPLQELRYYNYVLSVENQRLMFKYCAERNILPSGAVCQSYLESNWGASAVARADNNWAGMTGGAQTRPSGVVVTTGTYRPANEGGTYMRYKNLDDFFNDWTYLISRQLYRVAGRNDIASYTLGLFRQGGAVYDYAAVGYAHYNVTMNNIRRGVNNNNGGYLDAIDQAWREGKLLSGIGSDGWTPKEIDPMFTFVVHGEPDYIKDGVYFYNGSINEVQLVHNLEEWKYIKEIYNNVTGRELKHYTWDTTAPVYRRIFAVWTPTADDAAIKKTLDEIIKEMEDAI